MTLLLPMFVLVLLAGTQADIRIVSTPDRKMGAIPCVRTCSGVDKNYAGWYNYRYGIVSKRIDMSDCDFVSQPIVTAVSGSSPGKNMQCPSLNLPDVKSGEFTLYSSSVYYTADWARRDECRVYWTATGFTC